MSDEKQLAKIYYQDFTKNLNGHFNDNKLIVDEDNATFIIQFCYDPEFYKTKIEFCDSCFSYMNNLNIPKGHPDRELHEKIGHTSMSIGDYIKFEDGEIWVCKSEGWTIKINSTL